MKRIVIYLALTWFTLFTARLSHGQWTKSMLLMPESVIIYDIYFEPDDKGWAVGTEGYNLFYDGNSWKVHSTLLGNNDVLSQFSI